MDSQRPFPIWKGSASLTVGAICSAGHEVEETQRFGRQSFDPQGAMRPRVGEVHGAQACRENFGAYGALGQYADAEPVLDHPADTVEAVHLDAELEGPVCAECGIE